MDTLLLHAFSSSSASAAAALFSAIWQGAILAACVALCLRMMPRLSAAARSVIWLNVFALLILLHIVPAFSENWASAASVHGSPVRLDLRWSLAIAGAWAMLSLWRAAQLILSAVRLHLLASRAIPVPTNPDLRAILGGRQGGRSAELCTSAEVARPSVFGFFHPRILVPPELIEKLSPLELQLVVEHEMEHVRRSDDWTNLLQKLGLMLFPLNPALLWVERRLCAERELACDDRVLSSSAGRKAYAICLTRLAEYSMLRRGLSLALGAWDRQSELVRRVRRILARPAQSISGKQAMAASASLILGSLACAMTLARSPQLVSFAPRTQSGLQANTEAGRIHLPGQQGALPQIKLVKAVMPEHAPLSQSPQSSVQSLRMRSSTPQQPVLTRTKQTRTNQTRTVLTRADLSLPDLTQPDGTRAGLTQSGRRAPAPAPPGWIVLTEWSDTAVPPHMVIAVDPDTQEIRPTYAAVPFANGWLIVQI